MVNQHASLHMMSTNTLAYQLAHSGIFPYSLANMLIVHH